MRNRRLTFVVSCAALFASGLVAPTFAVAAVPADLSITTTSHPPTVSAGGSVLYRSTVRNEGTVKSFSDIEVTNKVPPGTTYQDGLSSTLCDPAPGGARCRISGPLKPGEAVSYNVVVTTSANAPPPLTNVAEITRSSPRDTVTSNNRDTADTEVMTIPHAARSFLARGAKDTVDSRFGRADAFSLATPTSGTEGVVFHLAALDPGTLCSPSCLYEDAVLVDFDKTLPAANQVQSLDAPMVAQFRMSPTAICRGIGGPEQCFDIRFTKTSTAGELVKFCPGAGPGSKRGPGTVGTDRKPCKNHQFKTQTGEINFEILLLSDDPTFY